MCPVAEKKALSKSARAASFDVAATLGRGDCARMLGSVMDLLALIDKRRHWWRVFVAIFAISIVVVGYLGYQTYQFAPPIVDFVDSDGAVVIPAKSVQAGQRVFLRRGLMEYGSFLGDGAMRGPDFSAEALHLTAASLARHFDAAFRERLPDAEERGHFVGALVAAELKHNGYDPTLRGGEGAVVLSAAQAAAFAEVVDFYRDKFGDGVGPAKGEAFLPARYLTDVDARDAAAFFFWGGWFCAARRPGYTYSYTQNWPYDPHAGNFPHAGILLWSVIGLLVVIFAIGALFYVYGRIDRESLPERALRKLPPLAMQAVVDEFKPTPTQRALYGYFAVATLLFAVQVSAGLLTIADFLGLYGADGASLPMTVMRAWHSQLSVLWIAVCWFGATIWVLPQICRPEPRGQLLLIRLLFWMLVVVGAGTLIGIPAGILGALVDHDAIRWFGLQGWEFMQIGRAWHVVLYLSFALWLIIAVRGLWPMLRKRQTWSLPAWMVYSIAGILFMFSASFVSTPDTNFVIADFWRWCTIHMWVEAFFELFTTIIVAYFLYLMGFVTHAVAARVVYLSALLFLGSGLVGIAHNFYWNAKSIESVALGGVLSSLQVAPLVLLTIEAWRFRHLPADTIARAHGKAGTDAPPPTFGLAEPFMFLVGVNFWNFFGAGVLGFLLNLPIVNYYQHGTYLTVNHGHAALMGVYGNLAIAAMLFCARWNLSPARWNAALLRRIFWSINVGLMLMVILDLFPVGLHQLNAVVDSGYAYARSAAYIESSTFIAFTWLRGIGVAVFVVGGVVPLLWFMLSRWAGQKAAQTSTEQFEVPATVLAVHNPSPPR